MGRASFLAKRFKNPSGTGGAGVVCFADMNTLLKSFENYLTFNDSPTIKFDVSETGGIRAHHIPKNRSKSPSYGFRVFSEIENNKVFICVEQGYLLKPTAEQGSRLSYIMPEYEGKRLDDEEKPFKEVSDGNWLVVLCHSTCKAEIKIIDLDSTPQTTQGEDCIPIAVLKIEDNDVTEIIQLVCDDIIISDQTCHPFQAYIYDENYGQLKDDGEPEDCSPKLIVCPGYVLSRDCAGTLTKLNVEAPNGGALDAFPSPLIDLGASGDTLWAEIQTDPMGVVTSSVIPTQWSSSAPTTVKACPPSDEESGTSGTYYIPLFSIHGDDGNGWYVKAITASSIEWESGFSNKNIGEGANVYKKYNCNTCEHEFRRLKVGDKSDVSTASDDIPVKLEIKQEDEEIEFIACIDKDFVTGGGGTYIPPDDVKDGSITLLDCEGAELAKATFEEGLFKGDDVTIKQGVSLPSSSIFYKPNDDCRVHLKNNIPQPDYIPIPQTAGFVLVNVCVNGQAATMKVYGEKPIPLDASGNPQLSMDDPNDPGFLDGTYSPIPVSQ